jgi:Xaa-Pro aminopeptidase
MKTHKEAARILAECMNETFRFISERMNSKVNEYEVQQFILSRFDIHGVETSHAPICAFGENTSFPHYEVSPENAVCLDRGMPVLVDMWARLKKEHSVYADITWMAFSAKEIPNEFQNVFHIVREARDAALGAVVKSFSNSVPISGASVDRVCRRVVEKHGYGDTFVHRTGHSLGEDVHGSGANLDSLESEDERLLIPRTGFTIEPGIYLTGKFGVRSEIDVVITGSGTVETTGPIQNDIICL